MDLLGLKRRRKKAKASRNLAEQYPDILEAEFHQAVNLCRPATMGSIERLYAIFSATRYIVAAGVPGAFVECGVWKGGSVMMMALTLAHLGVRDRDIYLFDTFEGMTAPTVKDVDFAGNRMQDVPDTDAGWHRATRDEVRSNLASTGYPMERFHLVKGDVSATLPGYAPMQIALLRLDTDWYESTRDELRHLFPRLERRGILVVDDYGHFQGAREAVDEYLRGLPEKYLLNRIDYTGRILIKA